MPGNGLIEAIFAPDPVEDMNLVFRSARIWTTLPTDIDIGLVTSLGDEVTPEGSSRQPLDDWERQVSWKIGRGWKAVRGWALFHRHDGELLWRNYLTERTMLPGDTFNLKVEIRIDGGPTIAQIQKLAKKSPQETVTDAEPGKRIVEI